MALKDFTVQMAIQFASDLEDNEKVMPEAAALSVTLWKYDLEWGDQCDVFKMLPDGEWWLQDERVISETS